MTYTFRNRFRLRRGDLLDADVPEIRLTNSAEAAQVTLWPVQERVGPQGIFSVAVTEKAPIISQSHDLVLQGDGYADAVGAANAGREWRRALTVALAREGRGVDFGPDDRLTPVTDKIFREAPPAMFEPLGITTGDRVIADDYQLLVYPTEPSPKFIDFVPGAPRVSISNWLETFDRRVRAARELEREPWSRQKALAYRLVHLALTDSNPETRHIQLVTAVEVLLSDQARPAPILDALDRLVAVVDEWPDDNVKGRINDILRQNRGESVTSAGSYQVARLLPDHTFDDKLASQFFKRVYDIRSRLVHRERRRNKPRPTSDEVSRIYSHLLAFVLDLLDAHRNEL